MWPNTQDEDDRLGRESRESRDGDRQVLTAAELAYHVQRGKQLRAEAMARMGRRIGAAVRRAVGRALPAPPSTSRRGDDVLPIIAGGLRSPLTSIRSSAEILRDNPDIDPAERGRFVAILLAEEARLEALISAMLNASSIERRRRIWQVRIDDLRLSREGHALRTS